MQSKISDKPQHDKGMNANEASNDNPIKKFAEVNKMNRRCFLQGSAAVAATAALSVGPFFLRQTSAASNADEWKLGLIFPLTGNLAFGGNEGLAGCEIAQAIVNDRGGVNTLSGKKRIVFARANAPDQTAATSEMNRLIGNEKVKLVTGSFSSAIAYTATAVAERYKVVYWESNAVVTDLTKRGFKYLFRTVAPASSSGGDSASFAAEYIAPKMGIGVKQFKIGVAWEDGTYGTSVAQGILDRATKHGLQVVANESYSAKSTDLSPVVLKLKAAKPDAILAASIGADAVVLCKQLRGLDVNPSAIIGTSAGWGVPNLAQNIGKAVNGIFSSDFPCEVNPKALTPEALALREEFLKRYIEMKNGQRPSANAWLSFAGTMVLFNEVFPKVKSLDPDEVRAAALSLDLPAGSMANGCGLKFVPHNEENGGQNERAFCTILQWLEDKVNVVYPEKYATRNPELIPLPTWSQRA
jgi:branched-chain amino acid transport system substrate-binding protein